MSEKTKSRIMKVKVNVAALVVTFTALAFLISGGILVERITVDNTQPLGWFLIACGVAVILHVVSKALERK